MINKAKTNSSKSAFLISLENINVSYSGEKALTRINWQLKPDQHWAIIGPNGAGKTTLLRLIHGDIWPDPDDEGRRLYALSGAPQDSPIGIRKIIALVSSEQQNDYVKNKWNMPGEDVVYSGFFDTVWLYEKPNNHQRETAELVIDILKLQHLRRKGILSMSQGEARKMLIARALVAEPRVLILDEFCNGLDIPSRKKLLHFVDGLTRVGVQVLYATHRAEELIPSLTHYLSLDRGVIVRTGNMHELPRRKSRRKTPAGRGADAVTAAGTLPLPRTPVHCGAGLNLLELEGADVFIGGGKVLHNITWQVKTGENWAVLGRNGSGKSTLLKLITGDVHPAWGGTVRHFGMSELVSLWDIRKKIGVVTPELQAEFSFDITAAEVVYSGFFSEIGYSREPSREQQDIARRWMEFFDVERLGSRSMQQLSYGEKRTVLIARAMVNDPCLLILDEPCSGLDDGARDVFLDTLTRLCADGVNIIMITHHLDELIPSLTHILLMDRGSIIARGEKERIVDDPRLLALFQDDR